MPKPYFRSNYAEVKTQFEPLFDNCVCIPLTKGQHALVDIDDYEKVCNYFWQYDKGYALSNSVIDGKRIRLQMHPTVYERGDADTIDHKNRNGLDNRKNNLRQATYAQNQVNRSTQPTKKGGLPKGVYRTSYGERFQAIIRVDSKNKYLGLFNDIKSAALAYDQAARKYHGDFAFINFPNEV